MIATVVVLASVYILLSVGFVIIYRTSRVLNFAHGEIFMVGGYLGFSIVAALSLEPYLALPISVAIGVVSGALIYFLLMATMVGHSPFAAVLVTIGLGIVIRGAAIIGFQGQILYPGRTLGVSNEAHTLFGVMTLTTIEILIIVSAAAILTALLLFFRYSALGIQMRAASQDPRLAAYRGINVHFLFAAAWAIATAVAMYTSVLYSFNQQVNPSLSDVGLRGLAVALVGGMDSIKGTIPAAFLVAALEIVTQRYISPQLSEVIPFLALLVILMVRPWGVFGTKEAIDRI